MSDYIPNTGDVVELSISAEIGKENLKNKLALVISGKKFNNAGYAFLCPIGEESFNKSFEVEIPSTEPIKGIILCNHVKSLDWKKRIAIKKGNLTEDTVNNVKDIVESFLK